MVRKSRLGILAVWQTRERERVPRSETHRLSEGVLSESTLSLSPPHLVPPTPTAEFLFSFVKLLTSSWTFRALIDPFPCSKFPVITSTPRYGLSFKGPADDLFCRVLLTTPISPHLSAYTECIAPSAGSSQYANLTSFPALAHPSSVCPLASG